MGAPYYQNIREGGPQGIRVPNEVQNAAYETYELVTCNFNAGAADYKLTPTQCGASYIIATNASGTVNVVFPAADPGHMYIVYANAGFAVTFLVSGQTGVAVADGTRAILICEATDIARVTANV